MVDLDRLFYPKNAVALIGVTDNPIKGATAHLYALKRVGYSGKIYCVNRNRKEVMFGIKAYPSILDIPDEIDYAIIGVPNELVPDVIEQCSKKGVKFCTIFTAGFSELNTEKGKRLEQEMLQRTANGLRIIGPNCLGPYCQESRITMTEILEINEREGRVAFISQSGGHTGTFYHIGENRGFPFNKVVSLGNQSDLKIQDFIEYFASDDKIDVISCYLERIKETKRFLEILKRATKKKPVIFWKGGQTEEGIIAASSHTGAIHSSYEVFKAAISQHGGIIAESLEELADLTFGARYLLDKKLGKKIGMLVPGGGSSVEMTDETARQGLEIPELSEAIREKIQANIQTINTNTRNPVDLGVLGWMPLVFAKTIAIVAEDPNVDVVVFYFMIERLPKFIERMENAFLGRSFIRNIKKARKKTNKPIICILPNFDVIDEQIAKLRKEFVDGLIDLEIPYFPSMKRAVNVVNKLSIYQRWRNQINH
ncbi:MAG: CoA-binding protein [Candidatus Helarchaeota archaeon]